MMLAKHRATHISIRNEGSMPVGITFTMNYKNVPLNFAIPCRIENVWKVIKDDPKAAKVLRKRHTEAQAARIAWRIVKGWVEVQLAIVEVEMATIEEVFLQYLILPETGERLADKILQGDGLKQLTQ